MCCHFDTMPACDRRTDTQMDGQTDGIAVASTALAKRALRHAVKMYLLNKNKNSSVDEIVNVKAFYDISYM